MRPAGLSRCILHQSAFILLLLAACAPRPAPASLTVFAAASLRDAFDEIGAQFEADHPGVRVVFNYAGSQQLAQQLAQGAPADAFASANPQQMAAVIDAGLVTSGTERVFARNRLVVVYPASGPPGALGLADLARPGLKLVLAAEEVPAGQYALEALQRASRDPAFAPDFADQVLQNVVSYEDSVRGVLGKVMLGEADAGIVYASDALAGGASVGQSPIPDALQPPVTYPIAPLAGSGNPALSEAFVTFVLSGRGQAVLADHGFVAER